VLKYTAEHIETITAHAQATYPEECCGLLIGTVDRSQQPETRVLTEVYPTQNAWNPEAAAAMAELTDASQDDLAKARRHWYWIDPHEIFQAQRYAQLHNLEIIGVYHSHPDHAAVPSESDRVVAWAGYSYVIVSVVRGEAAEVRCWCLNEQNQFEAEEMLSMAARSDD
jgi:proteasome lid subunit RPN8/RPN11